MNINYLILIIASILGSIYIFFSPTEMQDTTKKKETPLIELHNYTVYKFDTQSLVNILDGKIGKRFQNRYELYDFLFTDKIEKDIISISAKHGLYRGDEATFTDKVHYFRSDGLTFDSQKVLYNKKKHYIKSPVPYIAHLDENILIGKSLYYDFEQKKLHSKDVNFVYNIKNKGKKK